MAAPAADAAASPAGNEQALAAVLDELHQLGELDPAAQQRLIAELRGTKPELWLLVTQQFRSSLAYQRELAGHEQPTTVGQPPGPLPVVADASPISSSSSSHSFQDTEPNRAVLSGERPSGMIAAPLDSRDDNPRPQVLAAREAAYPSVALDDGPSAATASGTAHIPSVASQEVLQASFEAARQPQVTEPALLPAAVAADEALRPAFDPASVDWSNHVALAAADLSDRVADSPQSTAEVHQHATLRLLRLLAGQTVESLEPIPHISPVEQDYWSRQLFALATYLDHHQQPDEQRRAAASVAHLDDAVAKLRELGSLSLRNLTFCQEVYGFGAYQPYDSHRFSTGQQVSIYVEVENFRSRSTEAGYCTRLGATYEILNERGERVDGGAFPDVEDYCRSRRRDFHIQYGLVLPTKLTSGAYRLQLVVKDRQGDKQGSGVLEFHVR